MQNYECRTCHGLCDPGELVGNTCTECREKEEKEERNVTVKIVNRSAARSGQMEAS